MAENRPPGGKNHLQKTPGPRSVRRNLFGRDPDTQENLARDVAELKRDSERRFMERWNYDLVADRPAGGSLDWGRGIPLHNQAPLLHVPSEGETSSVSTSSSVASVDDISSDRLASQPATIFPQGEGETIHNNQNSNGCLDQPSVKKQRLPDSDKSNDDTATSHSDSAKR